MKGLVSLSWIVCALLLPLAGCGEPAVEAPPKKPPVEEPDVPPSASEEAAWTADVVFESEAALGGCAVGELDPDRPGLELIASDQEGRVHLVYRDGNEWKHELLTSQPGELIQCAIGDCSPQYPGNEIVAVGMAKGTEDDGGEGVAVMLVRDGGAWLAEPRFQKTFPALVHGVAITDMDDGGGAETVVVGFDQKATVLSHRGDKWMTIHEAGLEGNGKHAVGYESGVAVAVQGGHVATVLFRSISNEEGTVGLAGWTLGFLGKNGASQARLDAAGDRLLTAQDDGKLVLWTPAADPTPKAIVNRRELHGETQKLRGAALGDFDPTVEGLEAASAGYEGKVVVLVKQGDDWKATIVYQDAKSLHHLAHGDVLPDVPGEELVTCGHSGKLILIRRK